MPSIDLSTYKKTKKTTKNQGRSFFDFLNQDISFGSAKLEDKKKESFYAELGTLISSGIDLKTALDLILIEQRKGKDKAVFEQLKEQVLSGASLSDSIRKTQKFSEYEFHSIRIGEEAGKLAEVLVELQRFFKSKISQKRKFISAVSYPFIVLLTSFGAVFFMLKFVVPMFSDVFLRFGGQIPWITSVIIRFSTLMNQVFWYILLGILILVVSLYFNRNKLWFREWSSKLLLHIPIAGSIISKIYLARFANTMRLLVSANIPLLRSITLVRQMVGFYPIEESLLVAEESILKGNSLHQSLSDFKFYPSKFIQLIKVGEEVNRLDYFFDKIANQYTEEVEYQTATISSLLEPLIIIFLGLVVGLILVAMYLPMFQMSNGF